MKLTLALAALVWHAGRVRVLTWEIRALRRQRDALAQDLAEETDLRRWWERRRAATFATCCAMTDCRAVRRLEAERDRARDLAAALEHELATATAGEESC